MMQMIRPLDYVATLNDWLANANETSAHVIYYDRQDMYSESSSLPQGKQTNLFLWIELWMFVLLYALMLLT